ncbi:hypothetical protein [Intestinibacillus massiliensis]|uniref:hypothetical protein n=1 Tax=Intestinibacillus massiliensis TaxID=1871029 RepID=UPI000B34B4A1|nr:hypothetical protein [Intestinibacillus massiliensis]
MISKKEIWEALERVLAGRFPGIRIYRGTPPDGFDRPALALLSGKRKAVLGGCEDTADVVQAVIIQCIGETGADGLDDTADAVEALFLHDGLRVGGRVLPVRDVRTVCAPNTADTILVTVKLHYLDDRPPAAEVFPPAAEVVANITAKEAH